MPPNAEAQVALITGGARRIGAATTRCLHAAGYHIALHYRRSRDAAEALRDELQDHRPGSVCLLESELCDTADNARLVDEAAAAWGRLDALVNNASSFYPTPIGTITESNWDDLIGTNLKAPLFLAQAAAPHLTETSGSIVNIGDIHGQRPLARHPVYSAAKAGLLMLTQSLARELGPAVRVNAVLPGAILWPEHPLDESLQTEILGRTALRRPGDPDDVARAVLFLIRDARYTTGDLLTVDGGRSLQQ